MISTLDTDPPGPVALGDVADVRDVPGVCDGEEGMATAEYAVGVIAACGFAGLLVKLLSSDDVMSILVALIQKAVSLFL